MTASIQYGVPGIPNRKPGVCIAWDDKRRKLAKIKGDAQLVQRIWEDAGALGYVYIWYCLVSFRAARDRMSIGPPQESRKQVRK
jgi:hypothetical protein